MTLKNSARILSAACVLLIAALAVSLTVNIMQFNTNREAPAASPAGAVCGPSGTEALPPRHSSQK